jgi:hypothetical protein
MAYLHHGAVAMYPPMSPVVVLLVPSPDTNLMVKPVVVMFNASTNT